MALLDDVKLALRISSSAFDSEIEDLINEVKEDLQSVGILPEKIIDTDPLIKRVIRVYCKANFGFDNPDSERLQQSYDSLKMHLALSTEYTVGDSP